MHLYERLNVRILLCMACSMFFVFACLGQATASSDDEPYGSPEHNFVLAEDIDSSPLENQMKE